MGFNSGFKGLIHHMLRILHGEVAVRLSLLLDNYISTVNAIYFLPLMWFPWWKLAEPCGCYRGFLYLSGHPTRAARVSVLHHTPRHIGTMGKNVTHKESPPC